MSTDVRIPHLGESVTEGVIARWLKQDGDTVSADEPILELETDKATLEIPAGAAGRLEVVEPAGATVGVGTVVARVSGDGRSGVVVRDGPARRAPAEAVDDPAREAADREWAPAASPARGRAEGPPRPGREQAPADGGRAERQAPDDPRAPAQAGPADEGSPPAEAEPAAGAAPLLSPAVRRLVAEHGLDPSRVRGSGRGGRLTKEDVLRHLDEDGDGPAAEPGVEAAAPPRAAPRPSAGAPAEERVPMTQLRRRIAQRLVEAQRTAAILTTFNEVDLTELQAARRRHRERFRAVHGVELGLVSLFARAVVLALGDVPVVNARIDGDAIVYQRGVHLGIAVSTERGLVVPVVRDAHALGVAELERAIGHLARRAREGKLVPDDLAGGTFTITNGGVFGSLLSTPILNPPQSGILGMHKIQERPVAVEGQVVIRPMMYVALSYDHRLVDGEQAVTFLVRVKERLEDPVRMLFEV